VILAGAAIAFVAGVVLGSGVVLPGWILLCLAACLLTTAWPLRRWRTWRVVVLAAALCLGFWRAPHTSPRSPGDLSYYNGQVASVTGTVSAEPDLRDTGANYQVTVETLKAPATARHVNGGLYVHTSSAVHLDFGDQVSLTGRLLGTGSGGFTDFLTRQGIRSEMRYPRLVNLGPSTSVSSLSAALAHLRQRLEAGIDAWLPEPEAALLIAIALGARSSELGDLAPILVTTGLIHLIAISGIKVALVAGMIQQAIRSLAGRLLSFVGAVSTLWLYVLLTGLTASGVRSAGMWSLVFLAGALGRQTVALLSLCVVASVMVAADPSLPWDIGFELSTVGTLSIVAFADRLDRLIPSIQLYRGGAPAGDSPARSLPILPTPFREAFIVTLAAQVATIPIVIVGFHVVSATGPLANTLVLPFLPLLIMLGFLLGATSSFASIAAPIAALAYPLLHLIVVTARAVASLGGAPTLTSVGPLVVSAYYGLLGAIAWTVLRRAGFAPLGRYRGQSRELTVAGVVGLTLLSASLVSAKGAPPSALTWLGTGKAMLLRSGGMTALIDGSNHPFTLLERLGSMLPFDTHVIDLIVVTDPRSANVSGLESVLQHYRIGEVLDVGAEYPSATYARWRAELRAARIRVYALRTGVSIALGTSRLTVIGPDAANSRPQDSAGMLRIAFPGQQLLLASAADVREQHEAVFRAIPLRANTLVEGGKQDAAFVHAVGARSVINVQRLPSSTMPFYPPSS